MKSLVFSNWELDLSDIAISDYEENSWFSDSFFVKYSFPFEFLLDQVTDDALGVISHLKSSPTTYWDCFYIDGQRREKAIFEIEEMEGMRIRGTVRYGLEQIASFDKKLSELNLMRFELPQNQTIYQHANVVVESGYPTYNYNFPAVHIDKIDNENEPWLDFKKIINHRATLDFINVEAFYENEVDLVNEVSYNRNIIQPMPYLMYLLKKGFEESGYELAGDILQDDRLLKACVYADVEYYTFAEQQPLTIFLLSADRQQTESPQVSKYEAIETLPFPGRYRIIGNISGVLRQNLPSSWVIKYRDVVLANWSIPSWPFANNQFSSPINIVFDTFADLLPNEITITSLQPSIQQDDKIIFDLNVNPIRLHDDQGTPIPTVINKNQVDLNRAVPDMTFQTLVKAVKNWFNYDLIPRDGLAVMNKIAPQVNRSNVLDISWSEIKEPRVLFRSGESFELKFSDVDSDVYKFLPVFQDKDSIQNTGYRVNDKTTTIEIQGLPLPRLNRNNVTTAHAFESGSSKLFLVPYAGLNSRGDNWSETNDEYLLPAVHETDWRKWFDFRLRAKGFIWSFIAYAENIQQLNAKRIIWAYETAHVIRRINRNQIKRDVYEVEIESETINT